MQGGAGVGSAGRMRGDGIPELLHLIPANSIARKRVSRGALASGLEKVMRRARMLCNARVGQESSTVTQESSVPGCDWAAMGIMVRAARTWLEARGVVLRSGKRREGAWEVDRVFLRSAGGTTREGEVRSGWGALGLTPTCVFAVFCVLCFCVLAPLG